MNEVNVGDLSQGFIEGPVYWLVLLTGTPATLGLLAKLDTGKIFKLCSAGSGVENLPIECPRDRQTGVTRPWRRVQLLQSDGVTPATSGI